MSGNRRVYQRAPALNRSSEGGRKGLRLAAAAAAHARDQRLSKTGSRLSTILRTELCCASLPFRAVGSRSIVSARSVALSHQYGPDRPAGAAVPTSPAELSARAIESRSFIVRVMDPMSPFYVSETRHLASRIVQYKMSLKGGGVFPTHRGRVSRWLLECARL